VHTSDLRPLGAGELLDRAITIFVRRFVPIMLALAVVEVPLLIAQALLAPDPVSLFDIVGRIGAGGRQPSPAAVRQLSDMNAANMRLALLSFLVRFVQWNAVIAVVSAAYAGTTVALGAAYRLAVRLWIAQIVVALVYAVIGLICAIPWFILYVAMILFTAFVASVVHVQAIAVAVGVIVGLAVLAAGAVVGAWVFIASAVASVAVVSEGMNPVAACTAGLRRTFGASTRVRSIVAGIVAFVVAVLGTLPAIAVGALLAEVTHVHALYWALAGPAQLLAHGLLAAFIVCFAVDVRVRREGIDLLAAGGGESSLGTAPA